jgi:hypothetical protein
VPASKNRTLYYSIGREEKRKRKPFIKAALKVRMDSHSWLHKRGQICQRERTDRLIESIHLAEERTTGGNTEKPEC